MGPIAGRAAGYCGGRGMPGLANTCGRGFGRGQGFGRGGGRGGRGRRNRFHATGLTGEPQLDTLKAQAEYFENALGDIRQRIEELRAKAGQDTGESRG